MYEVNGETFRTKADVIERVQGIRDRYGLEEPIGDGDVEFLVALLQYHPDKDDGWWDGIVEHFVGGNRGGTRSFYVRYEDGSCSDWSFHRCVKHMTKK